jgi:hypothetical protein
MDSSKIESITCQEIKSDNTLPNLHLSLVEVKDIKLLAEELTKSILSDSWVLSLDKRSKRAYEKTYEDTANALVEVFQDIESGGLLGAEFGEVMVSIGSAKGLDMILGHTVIPIAELWKPKKKQNEGFDFHTVCKDEVVNFGEAKFSFKGNPYGDALRQIKRFIDNEKHLRDAVHLERFTTESAMNNLDDDKFGVVAAFSINGDLETNISNAVKLAEKHLLNLNITAIYLVGVKH